MNIHAVALGELLIDFTGEGQSARGNPVFEANAGGAPGNVMAMMAKLGRKTAFIGKVGDDMFGNQLVDALKTAGIDPRGVVRDPIASTALAFVRNLEDGEREFSFIRDESADTRLKSSDLDTDLLENIDIFHFGSLSLTHESCRNATADAINIAKRAGAIISFDPNLREKLWQNLVFARKQIQWGAGRCDVMKIADDELIFLTGHPDLQHAAAKLRADFPNIRLLAVTRGARGACAFWGDVYRERAAFLSAKTIDTTGAGDIFWGCCLDLLLTAGLDAPGEDKLEQMLAFACAAACLVTERKGALLSVPDREEIMQFMNNYTSFGGLK